jgi:ectoine hydroxylase-related dioxygenase (phytanoyl-CoA dioxygenase family)
LPFPSALGIASTSRFNQPLHRDDDIHYADRPRVDTYPKPTNSREYGIGFFVAGTKTTKANGATRFIPGSHLEATLQPPDEAFAQYAELNPGDGFIMLSSCYHGGSANKTKDEERLLFSCFMTRGWLRQEENQYLAVPLETVKRLPLRIQKLMGYATSDVSVISLAKGFNTIANSRPFGAAYARLGRFQRPAGCVGSGKCEASRT